MIKYLFLLIPFLSFTQNDSIFIRKIYDTALESGKSYEDLRSLCKDVGARLSGSAEAQMAVEWSYNKMKSYQFDTVYLQSIMVPHWKRGTKEAGWIKSKDGKLVKVNLLALGGSIGTNGIFDYEIIEFQDVESLKKANPAEIKDKIVFLNQKMDQKYIATFQAYGQCYPIRGNGAIEASKLGAKAVLIRSLSSSIDEHPHTGAMNYNDSITKIPAAALSTKDAELLSSMLFKQKLNFILEMDCKTYPPTPSFNVIAELKGKSKKIITLGGHLDSWDAGEGAHDDGAGVIHCLEALRILKTLNYKPNYTLRLVFFMNEENGNMGGKTYAAWVKEKNEEHIAALESDRGGFAPRGFSCDGSKSDITLLKSFEKILTPYDLHVFEKGYGGVDISPMKDYYETIPLYGFVPDSQRYFDFHHSPNDVFENVNKRELELGAAAISSMIYLLDRSLK